jgi:simple sugar transport system substrate-binding protein
MKRIMAFFTITLAIAVSAFAAPPRIGVFIPGVREGSPTYEDLASGAEKLVSEIPGASVKVFEAGFNQAEWEEKFTAFVATGKFDFVITSNPSLPDIIRKVSPMFPGQKFIALDGYAPGVKNLYTVLYNQVEQAYIAGYLAGLVSVSSLPGANSARKAGVLIGQHYPVMDKLILPGFEQGLKAVDPAFQIDLRVLGNWYDATKAAELASGMIGGGADVLLPIAGSASQGVIKTAQETGKYLVFFDSDEYARAPKNIVGCVALNQKALSYNTLKSALGGTLAYGTACVVGFKEGYIELLDKNPAYLANVPADIKQKVESARKQIVSGALILKIPEL